MREPHARDKHRRQLVAQRNRGKSERVVANHPLAVRFDVAVKNSPACDQPGGEPQYGKSAKAEVCRRTLLRKECQRESSERPERDCGRINASEPAMQIQRALAKFRRELPWTEKQRDASSRDVCEEDRKVRAEMPGWAAQEIVGSVDSGPAGHDRHQPPRPGGAAWNRKLRVERRGRSAVWSCRHDARVVLSGASISQRV